MQKTSQKNKTLVGIGIGLVTLGLLLAIWLYLDYRAGKPAQPATPGVKVTSLQNDSAISKDYLNYHFVVDESWLKESGFNVHKRLRPQNDVGGTVRFKPPTEYFEVGLPTDQDKGVTNINIVAVSMHTSGVTEKIDEATLDKLFGDGSRAGTYDEVRKLADGRTKADIAASGCIVEASGFEKDKVRKLVSVLFAHCSDALKNS